MACAPPGRPGGGLEQLQEGNEQRLLVAVAGCRCWLVGWWIWVQGRSSLEELGESMHFKESAVDNLDIWFRPTWYGHRIRVVEYMYYLWMSNLELLMGGQFHSQSAANFQGYQKVNQANPSTHLHHKYQGFSIGNVTPHGCHGLSRFGIAMGDQPTEKFIRSSVVCHQGVVHWWGCAGGAVDMFASGSLRVNHCLD